MLGMMPDPKKIASVIISSGGEEKVGPEVQQDLGPALDSSAQKFLDAVEKKDKKMIVSAIKEMFAIMEAEDEMTESED